MKKSKCYLALLTAGMILASGITIGATEVVNSVKSTTITMEQAQEEFLKKVDVGYSYDLAVKLSTIKDNAKLGYRTAGSKSELATGEMLKKEMEKIGLKDVVKDQITLDTWTFEKADLTYTEKNGNKKTVQLAGYQTNINTKGPKSYPVVYAGKGTAADLEGLDVEGKFVLIDINQRDEWWINYPAYEAKLHKAAGILAAQDGGYSEVSPDALNTQDVCGPADAVALSISRLDADALINLIKADPNQEISVTLDAKSTVGLKGKAYNIVGTIPGKNPDEMVLMSAHYDSYFEGFQDDNAAVALMFGIAKSMVDSNYKPEKTLVFCAMAAEEWGATDTRYDWSTGAYNQIFKVHPEWAGKVIANINFELPAMNEGAKDQIRSSYELKTFNDNFFPRIPLVNGIFPEGVESIVPTQTWSDDFSLSIAGIPANVTALRSDFSKTHYHSQYDNKDTYSEEAFLFHHNMYGMLMIEYDKCVISPLDFSTRMDALLQTIDTDLFEQSKVDTVQLKLAANKVKATAKTAYAKIEEQNNLYRDALNSGDPVKAATIHKENQARAKTTLDAFKYAQDNLVKLTWEDVAIFPHQHSQNNIAALQGAIDSLAKGDVKTALDEHLYLIDNNWYAYDWSKETFDHFTNYVLKQPADRLFWGAGRVQGHENLFQVIKSLQGKYETASPELTGELSILTKAHQNQITMLKQQVSAETNALHQLNNMLNKIIA